MNIAVCDDQAEELETVTELLRQWQAQRRCPLHFRTFRSAAQLLDAARRERFTLLEAPVTRSKSPVRRFSRSICCSTAVKPLSSTFRLWAVRSLVAWKKQ